MFKKISTLLRRHSDVMLYLIFGVLTTAVIYLVYLPSLNLWGFSAAWSNVVAWIAAVIFAYLTNKSWVFGSRDWSVKTVFPEFLKFAGSRVGSGLLVTLCIMVTVEILGWNFMLMKLATSVLNIVLNYIASKLLVFRDKKS